MYCRPRLLLPTRNTRRAQAFEEDDSDEKGGESSGANDELQSLDVDDNPDETEEPLSLEIPTGYVLVRPAPAALTAELVKRPTLLRLGIGWLKGTMTRQAQARTRHLYDYRFFVDRDGSTHSVKLPLSKYFDGRLVWGGILSAAEVLRPGRWV